MPELERAFGAWQRGAGAGQDASQPVPRARRARRVYLIDKPDAPQSVIVAAHVSEPGGQPEDLAIETVMRNFGGIATSRLNRNLRLDKHWSYGTQGVLHGRARPAAVHRHRAGADRQDEGVDGRSDRRRLRGVAGARPDRRRGVRQHHAHPDARPARAASRRSTRSRTPRCSSSTTATRTTTSRTTRRASARSTKQALATAARSFIRPDEVDLARGRRPEKVEAGIRELKLGEVVRLDADGRGTND